MQMKEEGYVNYPGIFSEVIMYMTPRKSNNPGIHTSHLGALTSTHRGGHLPGGDGLVGGPGEGVGRPAGHAVDLLALLEGGHQARPLDGVGRAVAQLTLVVVAPREHLA